VIGAVLIAGSGEGQVHGAGGADLKVLKIALTPTHDPDKLLESSKPLVAYLESTLNMKVKVINATNYSMIVHALESKHVDLAFMPGLPTVFAIQTADCRPICIEVQRGATEYYSHIYVHEDSDIKTLADLKGKTIAFTDPYSSSGFLYPISLFYEQGLIERGNNFHKYFKRFHMLGGYETALNSMYNRAVDASCGSEHAPTWYLDANQRKKIRLLAKAGPLPTHGIVVRNSLGEGNIDRIQAAFLELNKPEYKNILKNLYHADGLEKADVSHYDSVYEKALSTGLYDDIFKEQ